MCDHLNRPQDCRSTSWIVGPKAAHLSSCLLRPLPLSSHCNLSDSSPILCGCTFSTQWVTRHVICPKFCCPMSSRRRCLALLCEVKRFGVRHRWPRRGWTFQLSIFQSYTACWGSMRSQFGNSPHMRATRTVRWFNPHALRQATTLIPSSDVDTRRPAATAHYVSGDRLLGTVASPLLLAFTELR